MNTPKLNILVAYPYFSKDVAKAIIEFNASHPNTLRLFVDSGAFTAHTTGKEITLNQYCGFIDSLPVKPWRYIALDVIGDEDGTRRNLYAMYERGYKPVPVFTHGQSLVDVDNYYKLNDLICYGGLVGIKQQEQLKHDINNMMQLVGNRKVHLLGYTSMPWIKKFRPYSCDSSSFLAAGRYGNIDVYMGNGQMARLNRKKIQTKPSDKIMSACRRLGFTAAELAEKKNWVGGNSRIMQMSATSWLKMAQDCEQAIGTKLFLAFATGQAARMVFAAYDRLRG